MNDTYTVTVTFTVTAEHKADAENKVMAFLDLAPMTEDDGIEGYGPADAQIVIVP